MSASANSLTCTRVSALGSAWHSPLLDPRFKLFYSGDMPTVLCKQCDKSFYVKPNRLEKGWGSFCSNTCKHRSLKTGSLLECYTCAKPLYRNLTDQKKSQNNRFFCNRSCQAIWKNSRLATGVDHPNWKTGISSYREIMKRQDVPLICTRCSVEDFRILAVHHKDKNRQNNLPSNLMWLCHNCHYLVHHYKNEAANFLM